MARGLCGKHYKRWHRNGDPLLIKCAANGNRRTHPLYSLYSSMRGRCYSKTNHAYKDYGARGITICSRWLGIDGFDNFVTDMGVRPEGYSVERIDNDRGYSPSNCKWATQYEQTQNQRIARNNKSGKTGVCWARNSGKWVAYIRRNGVYKFLGYYLDLDKAIRVRTNAEGCL